MKATATRAQIKYNRKQVLYLTGITDDQYNQFQIDTAKAFVEHHYSNIIEVDALLNITLFWQWWMLEWNNIDDKLILPLLYEIPAAQRHMQYRQLHQYVFNPEDVHQHHLMHDFRHMRKEFEKSIKPKQTTSNEIKTA